MRGVLGGAWHGARRRAAAGRDRRSWHHRAVTTPSTTRTRDPASGPERAGASRAPAVRVSRAPAAGAPRTPAAGAVR